MADLKKILLTGNYKEFNIKYVTEKLNLLGIEFCVVDILNDKDKNYKEKLNMQIQAESALQACSTTSLALVLGGVLDYSINLDSSTFSEILSENRLSDGEVLNSYDAVLCLKSSNPDDYGLYEQSLSLWVGTEHLRVVKNEERLLEEIKAVLGIPKPVEIERKLLIERPEIDLLSNLKFCRKIPITQAYLTTPEEGKFRVRKRGIGSNTLYIKTFKQKISDITRIEIETYISKEEYNAYLNQNEYITGVISKDRYCIVYGDKYFELDIYPFMPTTATLEIELLSEDESYEIPNFVKLIRDVSTEREYRNSYLAQKYGN